jgi:hypothetical protein
VEGLLERQAIAQHLGHTRHVRRRPVRAGPPVEVDDADPLRDVSGEDEGERARDERDAFATDGRRDAEPVGELVVVTQPEPGEHVPQALDDGGPGHVHGLAGVVEE